MRLVFQDDIAAWVIVFNGKTVAVGGTTYFPDREEALSVIHARGLVVLEDGQIVKPEDVPAASEPPADEVPAAEVTEQEAAHDEAVTEISTREEPQTEADRLALQEAEKAARTEAPVRRSPDTRLEKSREAYYRRTPEQHAAISERSKKWWEENRDKAAEYRRRANEKRKQRYATDPEYRARVKASNQAYQQRKKNNGSKETHEQDGS